MASGARLLGERECLCRSHCLRSRGDDESVVPGSSGDDSRQIDKAVSSTGKDRSLFHLARSLSSNRPSRFAVCRSSAPVQLVEQSPAPLSGACTLFVVCKSTLAIS